VNLLAATTAMICRAEEMVELQEVRDNYGKLKLFVGGKWVGSDSNNVQSVVNPAKAQSIAQVPFATKEEVNNAVESARAAFEKWQELPVTTRAGYVFRLEGRRGGLSRMQKPDALQDTR
jgi:delta 1-pyrroline-5-carboxylate dehydrogenase